MSETSVLVVGQVPQSGLLGSEMTKLFFHSSDTWHGKAEQLGLAGPVSSFRLYSKQDFLTVWQCQGGWTSSTANFPRRTVPKGRGSSQALRATFESLLPRSNDQSSLRVHEDLRKGDVDSHISRGGI